MIELYEDLGETSRRLILGELRLGPRNVTQIVEATNLKQPNVSNHLARMRARGIVEAVKRGREVIYRFATAEVEAVVTAILSPSAAVNSDLDLMGMAVSYARAGVSGDEAACEELVDQAFRAKVPLVDLYQDLLGSAMAQVGNWYKSGEITEAQEHMASSITERIMARVSHIVGPSRRIGKKAMLGCGPNSWHVIGLRMISDVLRMRGWKSLFLGANVPHNSFVVAVETHQPDLVLVGCGAEEALAETLHLIRSLSELRKDQECSIGAGGHAVIANESLARESGADFTARDLRSFVAEELPRLECLPA
jgi:MerR family transcriptional regulator, light-induced transcriptional regulator